MIAPGWWRRPPFLPVPDATYVRYRIETAYGVRGTPNAADVISYLEWCRASVRTQRRRAGGRAPQRGSHSGEHARAPVRPRRSARH
jgi:hypothetical protein